jgi:hypothetical protein
MQEILDLQRSVGRRFILITALCLILACGLAVAQTSRRTIKGAVADSAGAVIPGATVEAKNTETGGAYQAATTTTGNYTLSELPAGI